MSAHTYGVSGLILGSPMPLPFLSPAPPDAPVQVSLQFGPVPIPTTAPRLITPALSVYGPRLAVVVTDFGLKARIEDGCRVLMEVPPGLSDSVRHTWLFGPVMVALLHQRGTPPLHASVVVLKDRAIALAGNGGSGKSSTARTLMQRGARLMVDDQAIIDSLTHMVQPCFPLIKMWPHVAEMTGDRLDPGMPVEVGATRKLYMSVADQHYCSQPRPLAAVVLLEWDENAAAPRLERLTQPQASAALHQMILRPSLAQVHDGGRTVFSWATRLAQGLPVFRLHRPNDATRVAEAAALVECLAEEVGG